VCPCEGRVGTKVVEGSLLSPGDNWGGAAYCMIGGLGWMGDASMPTGVVLL